MQSQKKSFEISGVQFRGACNDDSLGGDRKDFYDETVLSLDEYLAIPTFIRQGKLLSCSKIMES